jgi:hypothetical protein
MDANAFLQMSIDARMRIIALEIYAETLQEEIAHMKDLCKDLPKYQTKDRPIQEVIKMAYAMLAGIDKDIKGCQEKLSEVAAVIEALPDPLYREVLTRRYIKGENWSQIADGMFYTTRGIYKVASRAEEQILIPSGNKCLFGDHNASG